MSQLLLYNLFEELRSKQQLAGPGLHEYYLLFDLLKHKTEYPIKNFDELAFVVETIWLKSDQYKAQFRQLLRLRKATLLQLIEKLNEPPEDTKPAGHTDIAVSANTVPPAAVNPEQAQQEGKPPEQIAPNKEQPQIKPEEAPSETDDEIVFSINAESSGSGRKLQLSTTVKDLIPSQTPFLFTNDYFPVKDRNLQQAWRSLKNKAEGKDRRDIDVKQTVLQTTKKGFFSGLLFEKETKNQLKLFIFIDRSDSMVTVEAFGKELCDTARRSEVHAAVVPWYFYSTPQYNENTDDFILLDEDIMSPVSIRKLFTKLSRRNIVVLLYSDAGTLKGGLDEERIGETQAFLYFLNRHAGYIAWLNPAPKNRWANTNAEKIKQMVPMFDTTRTDIDNVMRALKGKVVPSSQTENYVTA